MTCNQIKNVSRFVVVPRAHGHAKKNKKNETKPNIARPNFFRTHANIHPSISKTLASRSVRCSFVGESLKRSFAHVEVRVHLGTIDVKAAVENVVLRNDVDDGVVRAEPVDLFVCEL